MYLNLNKEDVNNVFENIVATPLNLNRYVKNYYVTSPNTNIEFTELILRLPLNQLFVGTIEFIAVFNQPTAGNINDVSTTFEQYLDGLAVYDILHSFNVYGLPNYRFRFNETVFNNFGIVFNNSDTQFRGVTIKANGWLAEFDQNIFNINIADYEFNFIDGIIQ